MNTNTNATRAPFRRGEAGFTLLESIIAMAILTIGILAVCMMQGRALRVGTAGFYRTEAHNVALALIEALQQLPSDDPMLKATGTTETDSLVEVGGDGESTRKVKWVGDMPTMQAVMSAPRDNPENDVAHRCDNGAGKCVSARGTTRLQTLLEPAFTVRSYGTITDRAGKDFDLAWTVQDVMVEGIKTATDKRIRVYIEWDTPLGIKNHLEFTTNKFASDIND